LIRRASAFTKAGSAAACESSSGPQLARASTAPASAPATSPWLATTIRVAGSSAPSASLPPGKASWDRRVESPGGVAVAIVLRAMGADGFLRARKMSW
jgi:hypothetical protein